MVVSSPAGRLVKKGQHDKGFGVEPMPGANILRHGKISIGLCQIVEVEIERGKAIIARKKQLRLVGLPCDFKRLLVQANRSSGLPLHWWI